MREFFKLIFGLINDAKSLIKKWDQFEKSPIQFNEFLVEETLNLSKLFLSQNYKFYEMDELRRRVIAFEYRSGICPLKLDEGSLMDLHSLAIDWKKNHPAIAKPLLTAKEMSHLQKTAEYPLFVKLIKTSLQIKDKFLHWILCDGNDAGPFIEFPSTIDRLIESRLSSRLGLYPEATLRMETAPGGKVLSLPFEGRYQSILDPEARITFRGGYTLTMDEIFQVFANKETEVGSLEYFREGICNWNIHRLAYWDAHVEHYIPIDIHQKYWWEQMPVFELLNRRQMMKRYGVDLKPHEWIASAVATRGRPNLDYEETHAFLEVVIPRKDGLYAVYDFGKLATEYPENALDRIAMMTKTVHATVAYPDDSIFYAHRQRGFHPFALTNSEGLALMDLLKQDILSARQMNMVYQIQSENCAKWVHTRLVAVLGKQKVPDLFRMQLLDTHPQGPVSLLFRGIKCLPKKWQVPLLMFLHLPLGAFRRIWIEEEGVQVSKSLRTHVFFKTGQIFLPALLIAKVLDIFIMNKRLSGFLRAFQQILRYIFGTAKFCEYGNNYDIFRVERGLSMASETTSCSASQEFEYTRGKEKPADLPASF